ncbi:permease [Mycobacterium cookii]|uniref:Permease n=1 Tax=Mycobacterium cookii TaxID=1775 RepID=A0A7I7KUF7_9MYCO|nr:alpha/beta hydrolase [Mycobacterium cookii]MCV7331064.1 alpha/beta hydrolase [Mycobacterium cookii]BBX44982.1 permease [Mycobacterium cookii]
MQRTDIRAVGDLAGEATSVLTALVRGMHAGIAGRVFDSIGPSATPTRTIHDGLTRAIYSGVDRGLRGATRAAGIVAAEIWGDETHDALESRSDTVAAAIAAVNGIYGDELADRENPLAGAMVVRHDGESIALTADSLAAAFPAATNRVAVFVHGWCMTEQAWSRPPRDGGDSRSYADRLRAELGYTPIMLRYNTGLHISVNGRTLAEILDLLHDQWPVPVTEVVLVGHSMGGLVVRSACHYGAQQQLGWTDAVGRVVCLGSPHLGADLEKGVHVASWALAKLPETRAIAAFLNARSDGVKDLRYGACLDEDWLDADPDELLNDRCREAPFLPHATYHFVATTVAPPLLGKIAGDHLVRPKSAAGQGKWRRIPFDAEHGITLSGLHHFDLLNHPSVYAKLRDWLTPLPTAGVGDTSRDACGHG